jgi:hypothetical protein
MSKHTTVSNSDNRFSLLTLLLGFEGRLKFRVILSLTNEKTSQTIVSPAVQWGDPGSLPHDTQLLTPGP